MKFLARLSALALATSLALAGPRNTQPAGAATPADRGVAAQQCGATAADFNRAASSHRHLHLDKDKRALFACEGLAAQVGPDTSGYTAVAQFPLADTFALHSRPGAAKVIYLDFKGHTTANTPWNSGVNANVAIVTPPFDLDGDPATFSDAELTAIQDVWFRVAEDYAAWDVDVTTADPGIEAIRRTSSTDVAYGVRCVIGGSSMQWLGTGAGGVAYVGTFNALVPASLTGNDIPAFVFPVQLGQSPRLIAEAASHEVGHTLGLYHSGQTTGVEYYGGHADWAPIMGVGYYKTVTQWTKGDYPLSNNTQDQVAIISSKIPRIASYHGAGAQTASVVAGGSFTAGGIIAARAQTDWFKLSAGAGPLSVTGAVALASPDLKLSLTLLDSSGVAVAQGVPNGLAARLSANVVAGDYYLVVDGVGSTNDPLTGYTDYGSLGRYGLAGTWVEPTTPPPPPPPPVVTNQAPVASTIGSTPLAGTAPLTVRLVGSASSDPDGSIVSYRWEFGDGSAAVATPNATHVYAAGSYVARLTVTDNAGASASATVPIVVTAPPPPPPVVTTGAVHVASLAMSWNKLGANAGFVQGVLTLVDDANRPVSGALVTVQATGLLTGSGQGRTDARGQLVMVTNRLSATLKGDVTFAVAAVSHPKLAYDPTKNVVSAATLTLTGTTTVVQPPGYRPWGDRDDYDRRRR